MAQAIYSEEIHVGDVMPVLVKAPIDKVQLVKYAGASGDFNPLHFDPEFAKTVGIGGTIAHGMLIMGFVGQAMTNWIPKKYIRKFGVRFAEMTKPGDVVTVTGVVKEKIGKRIVCDLAAKNQDGKVLIVGSFEAELPTR
ncbi:MAG: MaoC/PaaZ C-terminal domain-containing protein [Thermodesulfobacteriota bacterium]